MLIGYGINGNFKTNWKLVVGEMDEWSSNLFSFLSQTAFFQVFLHVFT